MANSTGGLIDSITAHYAPVVEQIVNSISGDASALRDAAAVVYAGGRDIGDVRSALHDNLAQLADWSGQAKTSFDRASTTELNRLDSTTTAALRCADAMDTLATAVARIRRQAWYLNANFKANATMLSAAGAIPFVDEKQIADLARRNGEKAVAAGQAAKTDLEARLAEFIAAISSAAGITVHTPGTPSSGSGGQQTGTGAAQNHAAEWTGHLKTAMAAYGVTDLDEQAYILATVEHETAGFKTMREKYNGPSREDYFENKYGYQTNVGAILGNTQPGDGARYAGTGMVQLTGRDNFHRFGYEDNPEAAADPQTAADIAVRGMRDGLFRQGHQLSDYHLPDGTYDFYNARDIVNGGHDKAQHIADLAQIWRQRLAQE